MQQGDVDTGLPHQDFQEHETVKSSWLFIIPMYLFYTNQELLDGSLTLKLALHCHVQPMVNEKLPHTMPFLVY
jgi:hypothetical protein